MCLFPPQSRFKAIAELQTLHKLFHVEQLSLGNSEKTSFNNAHLSRIEGLKPNAGIYI